MGPFGVGGVYFTRVQGYHGLREATDISNVAVDGCYNLYK